MTKFCERDPRRCAMCLHIDNNNRLFMPPHLISKSSEHLQRYKDTLISSHTHTHACTHTHTHTQKCITGDGLVKQQISMQRRRDGFLVLTKKKRARKVISLLSLSLDLFLFPLLSFVFLFLSFIFPLSFPPSVFVSVSPHLTPS